MAKHQRTYFPKDAGASGVLALQIALGLTTEEEAMKADATAVAKRKRVRKAKLGKKPSKSV